MEQRPAKIYIALYPNFHTIPHIISTPLFISLILPQPVLFLNFSHTFTWGKTLWTKEKMDDNRLMYTSAVTAGLSISTSEI